MKSPTRAAAALALAIVGHNALSFAPEGRAGALPSAGPRVNGIEFGAFAPEAALTEGIEAMSISGLDSDGRYRAYRRSVEKVFGARLSDMNYLGVGVPGWRERLASFERWLVRSAPFGPPTVALEPLGKDGYKVFRDSEEMRELRAILNRAQAHGIVVWVRFASEANLRKSVYSVYNNPAKIGLFRQSFAWFKRYMPNNVRMVFCPLINTAYLKEPRQIAALKAMYPPESDRIGGTIYATSWLNVDRAWDWYYRFMSAIDPKKPFQICELGGSYQRKKQVLAFVEKLIGGAYPKIQKVNLFAGELNRRATKEHGSFGLKLPGEERSYLYPLLAKAR
jgi:hypothetical protein